MTKFLNQVIKNKCGRNNTGKIVIRFRKNFNLKLKKKFVDFKRLVSGNFIIIRFFLHPISCVFVGLIYYLKLGLFSYVMVDHFSVIGKTSKNFNFLRRFNKLNPSSVCEFRSYIDIKPNSACFLQNLPLGLSVFCVENYKFKGGLFARTSGSAAQLYRKVSLNGRKTFAALFLPSKQLIYIDSLNLAILGRNSNKNFSNLIGLGARHLKTLGRRPRVRGVAMNPVDHPLGGGEGKSSGGRVSVSKWGLLAKGGKTVSKKVRRVKLKRLENIDKLSGNFEKIVVIPN